MTTNASATEAAAGALALQDVCVDQLGDCLLEAYVGHARPVVLL